MKLLRGEYTEAKATSKTIPSFWDFVNIVYGVSSTGKSSLSAFSTLAFVLSEDPTVCNPDGRGLFSDISDFWCREGVWSICFLSRTPTDFTNKVGLNAKPYRLFHDLLKTFYPKSISINATSKCYLEASPSWLLEQNAPRNGGLSPIAPTIAANQRLRLRNIKIRAQHRDYAQACRGPLLEYKYSIISSV